MTQEKHEFAVYIPQLSTSVDQLIVGDEYIISDENIYHRIVHVLRLEVNDVSVFFDQFYSVRCKMIMFKGKKQIISIIMDKKINIQLMPKITVLVPVLKRDDFEQALYALAAVGVTTIQCIETKKISTNRWQAKDLERLQRIIIAAAEQSKNFNFPELRPPVSLDSVLCDIKGKKIFFDCDGESLREVVNTLSHDVAQEFILLVGPEGDLTSEEKDKVRQAGFIFCALTPTVLRSVHALFLGAGTMRSLFSSSVD